ncbi:MAG TPA: RNA pseudouridine synthase [Spirochaetota bacterium]|nr:RNA pseudouridine synthase [Spirochaetota bacterium]
MDNEITNDRILYRDEYLAVVYKMIGEVCENDAKDVKLSLVENMRAVLESAASRALPELESVHRIDQPVSGCVLLAFDRKINAALSSEFSSGSVRKKYWAIVEKSSVSSSGGRLEHLIRFDRKHHKALALKKEDVRKNGPDWKPASLEWKLVGSGDRYDFLEIIPETGRTHQIRAQLAASGRPIKGDLKYGSRRSDPLGGIRLHAFSISFRHPVSGEMIDVSAPVMNPDALWRAFMEKAAEDAPATDGGEHRED